MTELREADELLAFVEGVAARTARAGADAADCYVRESRTMSISAKGDIVGVAESHNVGFSVRAAIGDRVGFASASGLQQIDEVIGDALQAARGATPTPGFGGFQTPVANPLPPTRVHEALWAPDPVRISAAAERIRTTLDAPDVTFRAHSITTSRHRFAVATSEGHTAWDQGARENVLFEARIERGTKQVTTSESWTGMRPVEEAIDLPVFVAKTRDQARRALDATPLRHAVEEVILDTGPCAQIISKAVLGLAGGLVESGQSPFSGRLGEKVLAADLTLHEAPHGAPYDQRLRVDHEGVPTRPVRLVERGVVSGFLYDRRSAAAAGTESTGHGLRSGGWAGGVTVSAIRPVVEPGRKDLDGLIAGADRALFIPEALTGMFTANPTTGDFSGTVPFAFYVENGAVKHAVPHTTVGGNVLAVLASIRALGSEPVERRVATLPPMHAGGVSCAN